MKLLKDKVNVHDYEQKEHLCYVLSTLQRNAPGGAKRAYHYFDTETLELVHPLFN